LCLRWGKGVERGGKGGYLQEDPGTRRHSSGTCGKGKHLISSSGCVVAAVCSKIIRGSKCSTFAAVGRPRTRDEIRCNGGHSEELDGAVRLGDTADIAVLVPKNTVLIERHGEVCANAEEDVFADQGPGLQMDGNCTATQSASLHL